MDAETVISIFFGAVLAVFSFAVVGYAFVRGRQPESESSAGAPKTEDQALADIFDAINTLDLDCLLYTSPSPRDRTRSRMPSSA